MKRNILVFILFVITLFLIQMGWPVLTHAGVEEDITSIKEELSEVMDELSEVHEELDEIKGLLKARPQRPIPTPPPIPTPTAAEAEVDGDPYLGDPNAPITLIEFSDYQCPFCGRFSKNTLPLLKKEYIETGKLKYVFRDFPLGFHQYAQKAAEAAQCAGDQGKYWGMHDLIFENQQAMTEKDLKGYAENLALNMGDFKGCLDEGKYTEEVKKDMADGQKIGVRGTPSFVLGRSTEDGKINGRFIRGAQPFQSFKAEIESLLKEP